MNLEELINYLKLRIDYYENVETYTEFDSDWYRAKAEALTEVLEEVTNVKD